MATENKIIEVYHAGTDIVENPDCRHGRKNLDFGQGFYITDIYDQAINFARSKWMEYDYVEGGVADDRVINAVSLYTRGFLTREEVLGRIKYYRPNNQICILNQDLLNRYLKFTDHIILPENGLL